MWAPTCKYITLGCGLCTGRGDAGQARAAAAGAGQRHDAQQAPRRGRQPRREGRGSVCGPLRGGQAAGQGLGCMRGWHCLAAGGWRAQAAWEQWWWLWEWCSSEQQIGMDVVEHAPRAPRVAGSINTAAN